MLYMAHLHNNYGVIAEICYAVMMKTSGFLWLGRIHLNESAIV